MEFGIEKCRANLDWKTNFQESQGKSGKVRESLHRLGTSQEKIFYDCKKCLVIK